MYSRIKEARKLQGLTQKQLAELTGIARSTIGELENRKAFPKRENLEKIAKALGVDPDELYD